MKLKWQWQKRCLHTLWQFEELVSGKWEADELGKW